MLHCIIDPWLGATSLAGVPSLASQNDTISYLIGVGGGAGKLVSGVWIEKDDLPYFLKKLQFLFRSVISVIRTVRLRG